MPVPDRAELQIMYYNVIPQRACVCAHRPRLLKPAIHRQWYFLPVAPVYALMEGWEGL